MGLFDKLTDKFSVDKLKNETGNMVNSIKNKAVDSLIDSLQNFKDSPKEKTSELQKEVIFVVGTQYYIKNIMQLAIANKEYRSRANTIIENGNAHTKIFKYSFVNKPVKLIPEPKNKHDKNAIQVIIAGELVGYIPADECTHVKKIINKHEVKYISAFISGGEHKVVSSSGDIYKDEDDIAIKITIAYV